MRAVAARSTGGIDRLRGEEIAAPEGGDGPVIVRVQASAVNPADLKVVAGNLAGRFLHARRFPLVPGYDLSGEVAAVGHGVSDLAVGDRVFGFLPYSARNDRGAFAELVSVQAGEVGRLPES